jgi:N-methylhydantoinase A/oxoprolinase/acetone carboxylase beta subunit
VQGVTWRVQLVQPAERFSYTPVEGADAAAGAASGRSERATPAPCGRRVLHHLAPAPIEAGVYEREQLLPGTVVRGPAIIQEALCTTLVPPGLDASVGCYGELSIAQRVEPRS